MKVKPKILIADDSVMNQQMLTEILGDSYEYLYADNGLQALEVLGSSADVDLLLLDINMPELDGFGVLEKMKQRKWTGELPVMIISAEDDVGFIQHAYDLGVTDYINRPFNFTVVQRRVSNTLMLYARQRRLVQMVEEQVLEREKTNSTMVNILSHVIESRNNETGVHLLHVRALTELLLRRLVQITDKYPLTESDISMITTLSALHDIGKISVPTEVLNKPGKLTPEEWEVMKSHSAVGDALLSEVPMKQNDPMMRTAHEICRWHHERWDGKGYPDGLRGDAIPISAQVVAVADVYDALTSERCYKKAFTHEKAIEMITAGECGAFNPLLVQCLLDVADRLQDAMRGDPGEFDYHSEAQRLASEMLGQEELPADDRARYMMTIEQEKTGFFEGQCGGIQFEYDRWLRRVVYTNWYTQGDGRRQILYPDYGDSIELLKREDLTRLEQMAAASTPDRPMAQAEMLVPVNGTWRWHRVCMRTIWTGADEWVCVVGQFTDIHEEVLRRGVMTLRPDTKQTVELINELRGIFDVVRLVDPESNHVLTLDETGRLTETDECCYHFWSRNDCCENCSSRHAMDDRDRSGKLEVRDGTLFCVVSHYQKVNGRDCVLEIAARMDDERAPEGGTGQGLMHFYRDGLTNAFSRLYLSSFRANLEHADGVALIDVDRFKQINDTYGHLAGDEALSAIASRILAHIRDNDTLIRYGGDEFLLIFSSIGEKVFFRRLEQIRTAVRGTFLKDYPEVRLDVSIGGVYRVFPLVEAIHRADMEMYKQKSQKLKEEPER